MTVGDGKAAAGTDQAGNLPGLPGSIAVPSAYARACAQLQQAPRRWLVTGVAGFIGSHLLETLLKLGQEVRGLDNFMTGHRHNLDQVRASVGEDAWRRFTFIEGDIRDPQACARACGGGPGPVDAGAAAPASRGESGVSDGRIGDPGTGGHAGDGACARIDASHADAKEAGGTGAGACGGDGASRGAHDGRGRMAGAGEGPGSGDASGGQDGASDGSGAGHGGGAGGVMPASHDGRASQAAAQQAGSAAGVEGRDGMGRRTARDGAVNGTTTAGGAGNASRAGAGGSMASAAGAGKAKDAEDTGATRGAAGAAGADGMDGADRAGGGEGEGEGDGGGPVDYVLHQAALGSVPRSLADPLLCHAVNVSGFLNMLAAARDAGVRRFVYAASSATYGDHPALPKVEQHIGAPLSPYALSKYVNELYAQVYARCYATQTVGLRYFNVFGPRQDPLGAYAAVIPRWIAAMLERQPVRIHGDGATSRDFCFVHNAVQANILAATCADPAAVNQVYNVAVNARTSLTQLHDSMQQMLLAASPGHVPLAPEYGDFRAGDVRHSQADIAKAARLLGYAPTHDVAQGLRQTVAWYVAQASRP